MKRLKRHLAKLGRLQTEYPRRFLVAAFIVTVVAGVLAAGLKFDSSYEALLPENTPEMDNADRVREMTGGVRHIVLAIAGKDPQARLVFGRKLLKRIEDLDNISSVNLEFDIEFFEDRGLWLMDAETLDQLIPALEEAVKIAKWQANPMHLHLDEKAEKEELEAAWKKVDDVVDIERSKLPFFEKTLTSEDGKYTFMLVTPTIKFGDMKAGKALLASIHSTVDSLSPENYGVSVRSAGNLDMVQEQHKTLQSDLRNASVLALIMGILIVAVFTRRPSAPLLIGAPLVAGIAWTFAITRLIIGHVNVITGFLVAVLIGLGIDFGVHLFVRYQQEMRIKGKAPREAMIAAVTGTLPPALTSALTTAFTFFSFAIADFRGFSEFGLIAGIGVILTLVSSFLIMPPLVMVTQRRKRHALAQNPKVASSPATLNKKAVVAVVIIVGIASLYGLLHMGDIPFRNDYKLLRGYSESTEFLDYVDENLGFGTNPTVFVTPTTENAIAIETIIREQKESGRVDGKPSRIGPHFSIGALLPKNQKELRPRIERLREILEDPKLDRAEKKEGERAEQLAKARKMVKTEPWQIDEVPEVFRRYLSTKDGLQQIVFAWPKERNTADYQAVAWEEELELISERIDDQNIAHLKADETLIIAWVYRLIKDDSLPLLIVAAIVVLILLALDFRNFRDTLLVAFPLLVGMGVLVAVLYIWRMELNMFNLIIVPSLIGIGIDNAVHIYHRYQEEGPGSLVMVVRTTGMAALLASLTTGVGFGSSLISHHIGLKSLGALAVIGICATFLANTVFFPCLLSLLEKRKQK
jgi:hypothetical protein